VDTVLRSEHTKRKDALDTTIEQFVARNPKRQAMLDAAYVQIQAAQAIYDMRTAAGLTQRDLAKLVGTSASAICRLEDADYTGHTLAMLNRIASALGKRVEVRVVPKEAA
jgi:ribosome-binding protein aMBF1 (putative translation factor)